MLWGRVPQPPAAQPAPGASNVVIVLEAYKAPGARPSTRLDSIRQVTKLVIYLALLSRVVSVNARVLQMERNCIASLL